MPKKKKKSSLEILIQRLGEIKKNVGKCSTARDKLRVAVVAAEEILDSWDEAEEEIKDGLRILEGAVDKMSEFV